IKPNAIVINATIRSLKYNGNSNDITKEDIESLKIGIENLKIHILNMQKYTKNVVVCLNKFDTDTKDEIEYVKNYVSNMDVLFSISTTYKDGGNGGIDLAHKVVELCDKEIDYKKLYDYNDTIINKINIICKEIYHARSVIINNNIKEKINEIERLKLDKLPICIAKTQYSLSDNPKLLNNIDDFDMTITDIKVSNGAGFIVVFMGNIISLPGLSSKSAYLNMDIDKNYNIKGIF
ncbi:MAG: formate--tetrahydrofolate ligase, partial [Bacilli bacterium]|nr:formate--tetrahydrofolate ligase [Bacilli bacterium]